MPAFAAWLVAGIARIFATRLGSWVATALLFLGIQFAAQSVVLDPILNQIKAVSGGLVSDAASWVAFFNLDRYITLILSAYAAAAAKRVVLRRMTSA